MAFPDSAKLWCWLFFQLAEAIRTVRDGEPGKVTATFTQLMNSVGFSFFRVVVVARRLFE